MEVNKEEALRCLAIAQRHRNSSNLPNALRFAKKSVALYSTPEGEAMVVVIEREISTGGSSSNADAGPSSNGTGDTTSKAKASGVEEHVSSAHSRPGHHTEAKTSTSGASSTTPAPKKREYTAKQMEVVTRVKKCKHHQYYEILSLERTCTENDVKKAYKKLALVLHPDKNGAPGADEAFKMVSKAFQVLSDADMRASFDANPSVDPTSRGGGGGGGMYSRGGGGFPPGFGGAGGGFQGELNPEDLFNMFFGGGGGGFGQGANVFTFGGPGGFTTHYGGRARRRTAEAPEESHPMMALIPILLLVFFAIVSILPNITGDHDNTPSYSFEPDQNHHLGRQTFFRGVPYWVNQKEWEGSKVWESVPEARREDKNAALFSTKVKLFERGVENVYINRLHNECDYFNQRVSQQVSEAAGIFGIGADYEKMKELRALKSPACEQLRDWGVLHQQNRQRVSF
ncbi:hypothetical protein BD324DRAFT_617944 [Kockovaella imperatae]|uniref:J domain-containing protein n=1 Tax=Kockovaella imperatae TaxID=4999 RepID=A0A1Y1ULM0_9TREE|nr:hypothetical protein BD324DRAFT_617944 [Kockovaella imperatae]ORX38941.1 hypothetical protein BD324DRAFT_617944 [Kockovaella imperatae]